MTTKHLSDEEIQQYAFDKSGCDKDVAAHAQSCKQCMGNVEAYLQLFSAVHEQPKPVFGFDLPGLVLQQIPKTKSTFSMNGFLIYLFVFAGISAAAIAAYIFRKYIEHIFTGVLPMAMYLIVITAIAILIFQSLEMYRRYQKQMSLLN